MALIVARGVPSIGANEHTREAEQIAAFLLRLRQRICNASAPAPIVQRALLVRAIEREIHRLIPGVNVVIAYEHVPVRRDVGAQTAVVRRRVVGQIRPLVAVTVVPARAVVTDASIESAEVMPQTNRPLLRLRWLEVVRHEVDLLSRRTSACNQPQQARAAHVARIPLNASGIRCGGVGEEERVLLELPAIRLVERCVEVETIVENTCACKYRRFRCLVERVRYAEAWLNRAEIEAAFRAVGEVAVGIDINEQRAPIRSHGIANRLWGYVVAIEHSRLDVPPYTKVERQAGGGAPVILRIGTELGVVLRCRAVADAEVGLHRIRVTIAVVEDEQRVAVQILVERVFVEIAVHTDLEHVGTRPIPTGEGEIVTQRQPLLREVLEAGGTSELSDAVVLLADRLEVERVGVPLVVLVACQRFVGPIRPVVRVFQISAVDVAHLVIGSGKRPIWSRELSAEVASLVLSAQAARELEQLLIAQIVRELRKTEILAEGRLMRALVESGNRRRIIRRIAAKIYGSQTILEIAFIRAEEEQLVLDEWAARASAEEIA